MIYTISKFNMITAENIEQFNAREIVFNSTGASNLNVENAILTLENERTFYEAFQAFKQRFNASEKFKAYDQQSKCSLVFKWLQNFLKENKTIKEVKYIYSKVSLSDLIEVSFLLLEEVNNDEK